MQFKKYSKQRSGSIQGLRSLKDTLPKNIKKVINQKGRIYSETLNNWRYIVGDNLFKICYPKSFRTSNRFGSSTLVVMVKRGHEVDLEYSKKKIIDKMNAFFGSTVIKKIKFTIFENELKTSKYDKYSKETINVTNNKFKKKINNVRNEKIKKSLFKLVKVFKEK